MELWTSRVPGIVSRTSAQRAVTLLSSARSSEKNRISMAWLLDIGPPSSKLYSTSGMVARKVLMLSVYSS